uniref:ubiquitinyl hydrolase 1 n=1 Tax=Parastrongyloides trichosuri TaxID=131310 RepID=A0A0N4ZRJ6_PARTI
MDSIYFEKQEGQLCAQHAINMLLQDSLFTAVDLSIIAQSLDSIEREALNSNTCTASQNMDDSGYFSLQVIEMALKNIANLRLINIESPDVIEIKENPTKAKAFVLNLDHHWFVIRKFGNQFVVLNSVNNGPQVITNTYLSLYLSQMAFENYSIFIVDGVLPTCEADDVAQFCEFPLSNVAESRVESIEMNNEESSDEELQLAIEASKNQIEIDANQREQEELLKAIEESRRFAVNLNSEHKSTDKEYDNDSS